jgi:purine-cytosine permease-like protein
MHFLSSFKNYFTLNSNMFVLWTWILISDVYHSRNNFHRPVHTALGSQWQLLHTLICTRWVPALCHGHLSWFSYFKREYFWHIQGHEAKCLVVTCLLISSVSNISVYNPNLNQFFSQNQYRTAAVHLKYTCWMLKSTLNAWVGNLYAHIKEREVIRARVTHSKYHVL